MHTHAAAAKRPLLDFFWSPPSIMEQPRTEPRRRALPMPGEDFADAIVAATCDCIEVVDRRGVLLFINASAPSALGVADAASVVGRPWIDNWVFDTDAVSDAAVAVLGSDRVAEFEGFRRVASGVVDCWTIAVSPLRGGRSLVVSRDVGADRAALAEQRLINAELQHRIRNTLTIAQSLVGQTLRDGVSVEDARQTIADRLVALACASDMLTRTDWATVPLATVVMDAVAFMQVAPGRIVVDGPAVTIGPKAAFMLTMALHELSTNAVKYGALSVAAGHVEVSWWRVHSDGEERLRLCWTERDGPLTSAPVRTGFGSRLIGRVTERQLHGSVALTFDPAGVVWTLDAPLANLAA